MWLSHPRVSRHLNDHFVKILDKVGHEGDVIEFDDREPGGILEKDTAAALEQVNALKVKICRVTSDEFNQAVNVAFMAHPREYSSDRDHVCQNPDCFQIPSTIARELAFATHHGEIVWCGRLPFSVWMTAPVMLSRM